MIMTCLGCLTHPALCPGRRCPDYERQTYILSKIVSKSHGNGYQSSESTIPRGEVRQAKSNERCKRLDLGRMDRKDSRNRRKRINENCPPTVAPEGEQVVMT